MPRPLNKIILVADCPARSKAFGIFGRRCKYLTSRCLINGAAPLESCEVYVGNNKVQSDSREEDERSIPKRVGMDNCYSLSKYPEYQPNFSNVWGARDVIDRNGQ